MSKYILRDLPALVQAGVITEETAGRIKAYYAQREGQTGSNRLVIVFGILGALLVGMGLVLIIAHNWDNLSKVAKLAVALAPLLMGQAACAYTLWKRTDSTAWRESAATFLFFAIAISISIVGQVYHMEGNFPRFLMTWMLLSVPVIYVMRSSLASLLCIVGITWYGCEISYFKSFFHTMPVPWGYWLILLLVIPHYIYLQRRRAGSNFFHFHSWLLVISITTMLGSFDHRPDELMLLIYLTLFCLWVLIGQLPAYAQQRLVANAPLVTGSLGVIGLSLLLSFTDPWGDIYNSFSVGWLDTRLWWVLMTVAAAATAMLVVLTIRQGVRYINVKGYAFIVVGLLCVLTPANPAWPAVMMNVVLLIMAVFTMRDGAQQNRLSLMNYGLLILTALIICRFFDMDISFIWRGLMFVAVGCGFFVGNAWMIRKRKKADVI